MKNLISVFIGLLISVGIINVSAQISNNPAPYCMPQYGTVCTGPGVNDFIASFWTTGANPNISNLNSGCNMQPNNYALDECEIAGVDPGQTFTVNMISSAPYSQGFAVWIDWNDDGVFDNNMYPVGERVYSNGQTGTTPQQGTVQVPANQPCGIYRMRVRSNYISAPPTPCNNQTFGEVEDYNIFVNGPGCSMGSGGSVNSTISQIEACENETVELEVNGGPYSSVQWFEANTVNGTYTAIPGATGQTYTHTVTGDACFYAECVHCNNVMLSDTNCVTLLDSSEPADSITAVTHTTNVHQSTVCVGDSATLNIHGGFLGTNADWQWYEGGCGTGAPIASATTSITVTPNTTTTYYARAEGDCGNTICEQITITVNDLPNVNASADQTICNTDTVLISATGADVYEWNNGLGTGNNFELTPNVTTEYTVIGTDVNGCINHDTTIVTVNPLPTVTVPDDIEVCQETTISLTAIGANTYDWDNGVTNGVDFVQPVGTTEYTVIGTDMNGCKDTNSVTVIVHPNPVVQAGNDWEICDDESVTLTAFGADTYVWNNGITNGVAFEPTSSGTYIVEGTDMNGCTDKDTVEVVVHNIPDPMISTPQPEGCAPFTAEFENLTSNMSGDEMCTWYFGDGSQYIGCDGYGRTYKNPGCYDVTLEINNNNCVGTTTYDNFICVNPSPEAIFNFTPAIPTTSETTITFNNFSNGATEYEWWMGEIATSTAENPVVKFPEEPGNHEITLIAENEYGCTDTAVSVLTIFEDLIFYVPNAFTPDGDGFNETFTPVMTSGYDPYEYKLLIFNRWGEVVFESNNAQVGWDGTFRGQVAKEGTYVWKIEVKVTTADERREYYGHVNLLK